ncbi:MAG: DMT family transporter [Betaproteobacteria bacterium]|nr:DMT family transporter [Betaproteobacteria bacterium]
MGGGEWAMLLALAFLWGGSFFLTGAAVRELPPLTIAAARLCIAAAALNIAAFALKNPPPLRMWGAFIFIGLINNAIPFSLITWGQTQIAGGLAAILNATTPLFAATAAHFFTQDEKMSGAKIFGIGAGIAGIAVIVGADALAGLGENVWAQLAVLGAACSYGFATVFGLRFRRAGVPPLSAAAGQTAAASVILLPVALASEQVWLMPAPGAETLAAVAVLGLLTTALAYFLYFQILSTAGATNVMLSVFLVPVSAIILGALFLGEILAVKHFYGMALIGLGLAAIDGRAWKLIRKNLRKNNE